MDGITLRAAMGASLSPARYVALAPAFTAAMQQAGCTNVNRAAMWCAQLGHESLGLRYMEEIASGAAYEGRKDLGNTHPGDGRRFKGRGPIQVTGRRNYTLLSEWAHARGLVPTASFFVDHPTELASDTYGFLGAVWYWTVARPTINTQADKRGVYAVTRLINGGTNGYLDRLSRFRACLRMGAVLLGHPSSSFVTLKLGSTGTRVRAFQVWARAHLHSRIGTDGQYGAFTAGVVRNYQALHHLTVDGQIGPGTAAQLKKDGLTL